MRLRNPFTSDSFKDLLQTFRSVINPQICPGCNDKTIDRTKSQLCSSCWHSLPVTDHFYNNYINSVHEKFYGKFNLEFGAALWNFNQKGVTGSIIHNYKYKGKKYLSDFIAGLICSELDQCSFLPTFDLITSVPIHEEKLKRRGYNQSTLVASHIADHLGIPKDFNLLIKVVETDSQTRKSRKDRLLNIQNSVIINNDKVHTVKDKKVLIIDDTLTTGATIESCGRVLIKSGAKSISVLCICQAV